MLFAIIVGGLIGYIFGGLLGFLLGAAAGVALLLHLKERLRKRLQVIQTGFLDSVFAVMGAVCKVDGVITRDEIRMAEAVFDRFRLTGAQREQAKAAFNRGKADDFDLEAELNYFLRATQGQPALLRVFLQIQASAVAADGNVHPAEHDMLVRIAKGLGLPESQVDQLEAMLRGAHAGRSSRPGEATSSQQVSDAYRTLGVTPTASDAEIKKAYRKLMSENHPDKLAGRGMPESMREVAEERTGEISHAYDVIKEARKKQV